MIHNMKRGILARSLQFWGAPVFNLFFSKDESTKSTTLLLLEV